MVFVKYGNHVIEVKLDPRTGEETILYDGGVVSSKITVRGGTHKFAVKEESEDATYEVEIGARRRGGLISRLSFLAPPNIPTVKVSRNGKEIYST